MISKNMEKAINNQIQAELNSAYLYLGMAAYCEEKNFKGFSHWLKVQYQEETSHAMKLYQHLLERGGSVTLKDISAPKSDFGSMLQLFENVLEHERQITKLINGLYEVALAEKDYPAQILLHWFIQEQVEEEASSAEIVEKLKMVGDKASSILYLDKSLAKRNE
jgi:ferritin